MNTEERFWSKVDKEGPTPENLPYLGNCWVWKGGKTLGYGYFQDGGHNYRAHRYAWELTEGKFLEEGLDVHHKCHNKACVRPAHLQPLPRAHHVAVERQR